MNDNGQTPSIGIVELLLVAFIVLKLCDVIDWSWWWVLSPIWISFVGGVIILLMSLLKDILS